MPITELLERNARLYGSETALVEINPEIQEKRRVTWKEYDLIMPSSTTAYRREITWQVFDEKANRVANLLMSRGIGKGNKVAILLMNCLEFLPIYFGILKTGALVVPMNFRFSADEIEYCVNLSDTDVLLFGPEFIGRLESIADRIGQNRLLMFVGTGECPTFAEDYDEQVVNCSSVAPNVPLTEEDDAAIYFSSGTTGFPKAILHNHESLSHSAAVEQNHHGQTHEDCFLLIPPLYHTGAKMHWFGSLFSGSKAVLLKGTSPKAILEAISQEKCTIVWLLVPWAQDLLDALDRGDLKLSDYQVSQLRLMHIGAQPVPPVLVKRWLSYFPTQYDTNYGLSESIGPGCVHLGVENVHKVGAIGVPGYGWQTRIVEEDGATEVQKGSVGELCVKGPGVMTCYYNDPEATAQVLTGDGWLRTGDMAMEDEDGFIFLVDRKKDVIISGGENIYPVQIEDFIRTNEAVSDVAVIGLPDARTGERTAAIVQVKEGYTLTEEDVNQFCMALPRYKRPKTVILADVPRNATGKIEKPKLREMYGGENLVAAQNGIQM